MLIKQISKKCLKRGSKKCFNQGSKKRLNEGYKMYLNQGSKTYLKKRIQKSVLIKGLKNLNQASKINPNQIFKKVP